MIHIFDLLSSRTSQLGLHEWFISRALLNLKNLDDYLIGIKKKSGLENNFKKLGINIKENYSKIISGINTLRLSNNPVELKKSDIQNILFKHK